MLQEQLQDTLGTSYIVERELGGGGMSRVFVARDTALDRRVVIKVLHPELSASVSIDRFRREILLAATLQHPHIVGILSAGETDGTPYFIMPYVEGESLRARIARGRLGVVEVVHIMRDVARALAYAHERGVVHRDIKPDNVLISAGSACVADFGVAKALGAAREQRRGVQSEGTLTLFGTSLGTPGYMAPEQAAADPNTDQRADLYSFGVTAYEMLTGAAPYKRATPHATLAAQLTEAPAPIETLRADVPAALAALVLRRAERDPDDRPQTAAEILTALEDPAVISGAFATPSITTITRPKRRRAVLAAGIAAAVAALAAGATMLARHPAATPATGAPVTAAATATAAAPAHSIAVLPLVNIGRDSDDEYFADGMTEELTSKLNKVRGVRVASRTAAVSTRGRATSVAELGRALNVATLLEGTVQRDRGRIRLTARLVNVADGFTLWSDVYETDLKDIFQVQDQISQAIVSALGAELGGAQPRDSAVPATTADAKGTANTAAYNEYLLGRYFFAKRGEASLKSAIEHFKRAASADTSYALAYAGMADALAVLPLYGATRGDEVWPLALLAADHAIALDSTFAEGYAARGNLRNQMWRWLDAERDLRRAIALRPNYAPAHQWLGDNLVVNGRAAEAVAEFKRAAELDPTSPITLSSYGLALGVAGDADAAAAQATRAVELDPSLYATRMMLGTVQLFGHRYGEAIRELEAASALSKGIGAAQGLLGYAYAAAGDKPHASQIAAALERGERPGNAFALAHVYLGVGDTAKALTYLARAAAQHDSFFASESMSSPLFDPIRASPRFAAILNTTHLAASVAAQR
ncbi:MAG: protein kinase [Gemmatimonadaceae bacterium]